MGGWLVVGCNEREEGEGDFRWMCRACSLALGMCIQQGRSEPESHPARLDLILDAMWAKNTGRTHAVIGGSCLIQY